MTFNNSGGNMPAAFFHSDPGAGSEPGLLCAARRALAPARQILSAVDCPMLTIAAELGGRRPRILLNCWNEYFEAQSWSPPHGSAELMRAHRAIGRAGIALARQLSRRWPANAAPQTVGVITDGIGLAASGEHPAFLSPVWVHDQVTGRARIDVILPFGDWARWALLPTKVCPVLQ